MKNYAAHIAIFIAGTAYFLIPAFFHDLWTPDEPRYALVAQEMMWSGDYLVPRRNGEVYTEKPPLMFWAMAAVSWPFGNVSEVTARIPSAVSGAFVLVLVFARARRMYGSSVAWLSVVVAATAFRFWWQAHVGQLDMLLCLWVTLALYSLFRWHEARAAGWLRQQDIALRVFVLIQPPFLDPASARAYRLSLT